MQAHLPVSIGGSEASPPSMAKALIDPERLFTTWRLSSVTSRSTSLGTVSPAVPALARATRHFSVTARISPFGLNATWAPETPAPGRGRTECGILTGVPSSVIPVAGDRVGALVSGR